MGDLLKFDGITKAPMDPDVVLEEAKGELNYVLVIGIHADGSYYFASSESECPEALWVMEKCKAFMLEEPDD